MPVGASHPNPSEPPKSCPGEAGLTHPGVGFGLTPDATGAMSRRGEVSAP